MAVHESCIITADVVPNLSATINTTPTVYGAIDSVIPDNYHMGFARTQNNKPAYDQGGMNPDNSVNYYDAINVHKDNLVPVNYPKNELTSTIRVAGTTALVSGVPIHDHKRNLVEYAKGTQGDVIRYGLVDKTKSYNRSDLTSSLWKQYNGNQYANRETDTYEEKYAYKNSSAVSSSIVQLRYVLNENWSVYSASVSAGTEYDTFVNPRIQINGYSTWFLEGNMGVTASIKADTVTGNNFLRIKTNCIPMSYTDILTKLSGSGGSDKYYYEYLDNFKDGSGNGLPICSQQYLSKSLSASFMLIMAGGFLIYKDGDSTWATNAFIKTIHSQSIPYDLYTNDGFCINILTAIITQQEVMEIRIIPLIKYASDGTIRILSVGYGNPFDQNAVSINGAIYSFDKILDSNSNYITFDSKELQYTYIYFDILKRKFDLSLGKSKKYIGRFEIPFLYGTGSIEKTPTPWAASRQQILTDFPYGGASIILSSDPFFPSLYSGSYDIYNVSVIGFDNAKKGQVVKFSDQASVSYRVNKKNFYKKEGNLRSLKSINSGYNVGHLTGSGDIVYIGEYNSNPAVEFIYESKDSVVDFNTQLHTTFMENNYNLWYNVCYEYNI